MEDGNNSAVNGIAATGMSQDEYFAKSEERTVVTPENIAGLIDYPAKFKAMQHYRDLRPALSPAMSTGRAMNDFITCTAEEFGSRYVVEAGPTNPKTGKPYGTDSKAYLDWAAKQDKTPVSPEEHAMFSRMAEAYSAHAVVASMAGYGCVNNAVFSADICGVRCLAKVDKLYSSGDTFIAVDIKTTSDLPAFGRSADSLCYREQQALVALVLEANGIKNPQVLMAAIEKGPIPRCGVFSIADLQRRKDAVKRILTAYSESNRTGIYGTNFESLQTL